MEIKYSKNNLLPSYEIWAWVPRYEGRFEISNRGRVRSWVSVGGNRRNEFKGTHNFMTSPKIKKSFPNRNNYFFFSVGTKSRGDYMNIRVHRLVGLLFVPNPDNKPEVNHFDGDKSNNHWFNFKWASRLENIGHAFETGLIKLVCGEDQGKAKLKNDQVLDILKSQDSTSVIATRYNMSTHAILDIKRGRTWSHITGVKRHIKPSEKGKYKKLDYNI